MKLSLLITLAAMLVVNLPGNLLGQTTYNVSAGGSDDNEGTIASPWRHIHLAVNNTKLQPGDSIIIRGGTYYDMHETTVTEGAGYDIGAYEPNERITGIRNEQVILDEIVYQNPVTNGTLQIGMTNKSGGILSIYSIVGECVYKQNLSGSDSAFIQVNTWQKGLYLLNFTSGKKSITRKIIIR